jgi:hypothetical protein
MKTSTSFSTLFLKPPILNINSSNKKKLGTRRENKTKKRKEKETI